MMLDIISQSSEQIRVVAGMPESSIAASTKQTSNLTRSVAVINKRSFIESGTAHGTTVALFTSQTKKLVPVQSVLPLQSLATGIVRVIFSYPSVLIQRISSGALHTIRSGNVTFSNVAPLAGPAGEVSLLTSVLRLLFGGIKGSHEMEHKV